MTTLQIGHTPLTDYTVVYAADAWPGVRDAAATLSDLVARATGTGLPVCTDDAPVGAHEIVIGDTNRMTAAVAAQKDAIRHDGFALVMDGACLHIVATTGRGVVYGVYTFLEDYLGARFYTDRYRILKKEAARSVPQGLCRVENPGFMSRDPYWFDALHPTREGTVDFPLSIKSNHGELPQVGGGISYAGGLVHTLPDLAETAHEPGVQPCLTDEAVFEKVRRRVRAYLDENPQATIISVSQNDSYEGQLGCQCPRCRAIDDREGTPMGSLLTFVNRIAADIREDYPSVWVDTLAYRYTRKAPKTIIPAENVIIRLCSIECCFSHPLDDPSCPKNVAFKRDVEAWSAICKHLYIWDYTTNFLYYLSPFPNLGVLRDNVRFYREHHVVGLFEQGNYQSRSGEFGELRTYLLSKLLWEPDMSAEHYDDLMNEFLCDYYGRGWPCIRTYIDLTTNKAAKGHMGIYDSPAAMLPFADAAGQPSTAFSRQCLALWEEALGKADTPEQRAHVAASRIQALYYATFAPDFLPSDSTDACSKSAKDLLREMHRAIDEAGITHYRESTPVPPSTDSACPLSLH